MTEDKVIKKLVEEIKASVDTTAKQRKIACISIMVDVNDGGVHILRNCGDDASMMLIEHAVSIISKKSKEDVDKKNIN